MGGGGVDRVVKISVIDLSEQGLEIFIFRLHGISGRIRMD